MKGAGLGNLFEYFHRCRITDDLPELADGEYMVEFAEQSARVNKSHGEWELVVVATDMDVTDAA